MILPFLALIVAGNFYGQVLLPGVGDLFFPFITGKNFFFRIVVEIIFALWACIAIFDKKYRPKISPLFISILATVGVLTLSTVFGANPYKSLWSNYERMEGLIGHLHLLAYFIILTSVFLTRQDWKRFFGVSLIVSFLVSAYGYLQSWGVLAVHQSSERIDATLGNATYLAIFIIFNIFLIMYSFLTSESRVYKYILAVLFVFEAPVVFLTATRGAIIGLLGGMAILAFLLPFLSQNKKLRKVSIVFAILMVMSVSFFWLLKDSGFVQKNYVLRRLASISSKEQTVTSRFTIWSMAFQGFKERPILGWGLENFNVVFNKYYRPELWQQEPWFDRSHNVIFDWLIAGGIAGLLAYGSIFISALYMLWKFTTKIEAALFSTLFAVYSFHNLFVFDNLTSYFMFFSILGFVHFRYLYPRLETDKKVVSQSVKPNQLHYFGSTLVFISMLFFFYFINLKPLLACQALINTIKDAGVNGLNADIMISDFNKVFAYQTFGTGEGREQFSGYANNILSANVSTDTKVKVLTKAISELEKQIKDSPEDARGYIFLSNLYVGAGRKQDALKTLNRALELSPQKQQIFFLIADAQVSTGDYEKAFDAVKKAYDLDPTFSGATKNLAMVAILTNKSAYAEEILQKSFGKKVIPDQQLLNAYARMGNYQKVKEVWELLIQNEPQNYQYHVSLAATYIKLGNRNSAISELKKAIDLNGNFKDQGNYFINQIQAGKNP